MQKFEITQIRKTPMQIDKLELQAFEMGLYLVKLHTKEQSGFVYDANDKPMRFFNSQQVRETFSDCTVDNAVLVLDSPYEEMIGHPNKSASPCDMPFSMRQPY